MKIKFLPILLIAIFAITSCSKSNKDPNPGNTGSTGTTGTTGNTGTTGPTGTTKSTLAPGVYAAGILNGISECAYEWKNNVPKKLSENYSSANGIITKGDAIYIAGFEGTLPCYWKNDTLVKLSTAQGIANAIIAKGNDIYIAGILGGFNMDVILGSAVYWKNGVITTLASLPGTNANATGMMFLGNDLYICGYYAAPGHNVMACYWKNGEFTALNSDNAIASQANGIAANGDDIYVVGYATGTYHKGGMAASYWKNNHLNTLPQNTENSVATAVSVSNGNVYISGTDSNPVYWKNGAIASQNIVTDGYFATILAVNNDIYIGGASESLYNLNPYPGYWVNDTLVQLSITSGDYPPNHGFSSYPKCITVVK